MSNLTGALIIVLCINVMLFLGQASMNAIGGSTVFYNETIGTYMHLNPIDSLPSTGTGVDPDTGMTYTDDFNTGNTFLKSDKGSYIISMINAPANILKALGTPPAFNFIIEFLWYGLTVFLIVSWLLGRDA